MLPTPTTVSHVARVQDARNYIWLSCLSIPSISNIIISFPLFCPYTTRCSVPRNSAQLSSVVRGACHVYCQNNNTNNPTSRNHVCDEKKRKEKKNNETKQKNQTEVSPGILFAVNEFTGFHLCGSYSFNNRLYSQLDSRLRLFCKSVMYMCKCGIWLYGVCLGLPRTHENSNPRFRI